MATLARRRDAGALTCSPRIFLRQFRCGVDLPAQKGAGLARELQIPVGRKPATIGIQRNEGRLGREPALIRNDLEHGGAFIHLVELRIPGEGEKDSGANVKSVPG
jgi:hypothetical protein